MKTRSSGKIVNVLPEVKDEVKDEPSRKSIKKKKLSKTPYDHIRGGGLGQLLQNGYRIEQMEKSVIKKIMLKNLNDEKGRLIKLGVKARNIIYFIYYPIETNFTVCLASCYNNTYDNYKLAKSVVLGKESDLIPGVLYQVKGFDILACEPRDCPLRVLFQQHIFAPLVSCINASLDTLVKNMS